MSSWHFNKQFREANNILNLGQVNGVSRFTPQMLRRYHASQLNEAGMSSDKIDILDMSEYLLPYFKDGNKEGIDLYFSKIDSNILANVERILNANYKVKEEI